MRHLTIPRTVVRSLTTACAAAAIVALVAAGPARVLLPPLPGITYTVHNATVPTGDGPAAGAMAAMRSEYTAVVVFAAGRGRMDIIDGGQTTLFTKGDYVLFDSSDYIIVHPDGKNFYSMPTDVLANASKMQQSAGMNMSVKDVTVSLDTVSANETLGTWSVGHYRVNAAYAMVIDMSGMGVDMSGFAPPPMQTKTTTDYWYADVPNFPPDPLTGMGTGMQGQIGGMTSGGMAGMMKDLTAKMGTLQGALPKGKALIKTVSSMHISGAMAMGMDMTKEISGIKSVDVDANQLVLPDGFTRTAMPGMDVLGAGAPLPTDGGAKWRVKPGRGH